MWAWENGTQYAMSRAHDVLSGLGADTASAAPSSASEAATQAALAQRVATISETLAGVKVRVVLGAAGVAGGDLRAGHGADFAGYADKLAARGEGHTLWRNVDVLVLGGRAVHALGGSAYLAALSGAGGMPYLAASPHADPDELPAIVQCLRDQAVILLETARNITAMKHGAAMAFDARAAALGAAAGGKFIARARDVSWDTYAVGTLLNPSGKAGSDSSHTPPADGGYARWGDAGRAMSFIRFETQAWPHIIAQGENPGAQHLLFAWHREHAPGARKQWLEVEAALESIATTAATSCAEELASTEE